MNVQVKNPFDDVIEKDVKEWKATQKQRKFIQLPFDVFEGGYGGALGSGKTDVLLLLPLIYRFHENPRFKGLMVRRTFPELEQEVIQRSREYYPSTGAIYNESKKWWKFPSGAYDRFGHIEHDKDVRRYDGAQYALERWDEATSHSQYQYEYLVLRRCRAPAGSGLPAISRWGSNPGGIGHTYFRKRFLDPYYKNGIPIGKILREKRTGTLKYFLPATATDNPHLLEANPQYYARLQGISSEAERRAMILGDWYTFEGQVFDEFRLDPLPGEPDNARHVIAPFKVPYFWPKIMAIDWGYAAWTFVIWAAVSPQGRVYIYRTYATKKSKIREWSREICLLSGDEIPFFRDARICWSAVQEQGQDQTIYQQVAEALEEAGFSCGLTKGEKSRVAGKQLVHEYLRWRPLRPHKEIVGEYSKDLAQRIWRQWGDKGVREYEALFREEAPEVNLPKLQIFSHSPEGRENEELIDTIPSCVYDDVKKEDVKPFDGDDPYDCLRILLYAVRDYVEESAGEYARQVKYDSAVGKLANTIEIATSDEILATAQTKYYRECEAIEASDREIKSVRRKSFRRR